MTLWKAISLTYLPVGHIGKFKDTDHGHHDIATGKYISEGT